MLKYDDIEVAIADLPAESIKILAQRGFTHVFGNERSSYANRLKEKGGLTAAEISALVAKWTETKFSALVDGTFAVRVSGPRLSGIESLMHAIAKKWLNAHKGRDKAVAKMIALSAEKGVTLSKDEAFAEVLKTFAERKAGEIRAEAERQIAATGAFAGDDDLVPDPE